MLAICFAHAAAWSLIHYIGLGLLLRAQSRNKFLVRHFMRNYHYSDSGHGAVVEAFANWKAIYNLSMCMTYGTIICLHSSDDNLNLMLYLLPVSCLGLVAKTYLIPNDWSVGNDLLCHTLGAVCELFPCHIFGADGDAI
jgi:phosphatidylethanolamine N-methyltransferase